MTKMGMKRTSPRKNLLKISDKGKREHRLRDNIRAILLQSCGGYCMNCGQLPDWRGLSLHHKVFTSHNGKTDLDNCMLVCGKCHSYFHGIREL